MSETEILSLEEDQEEQRREVAARLIYLSNEDPGDQSLRIKASAF